jgi:hypothetical protein
MFANLLPFLRNRLRALISFEAWFLIVLGLVMFTVRTPMPPVNFINLAVAVTAFQTAGLMFMLCGFQVMISMLVWPDINLSKLLEKADAGNLGSSIAMAGLFLYNGLSLVASVLWLSYAVGAQVGR